MTNRASYRFAQHPALDRTLQYANRPILIEGDAFPVRLRRSRTPKAAK
jgi:hypothetical protein